MRRITASVVMYGNATETLKSVNSIAQHTASKDFRLFLVDNASPDNSLKEIAQKALPSCVQLCPLTKNRGFGAGHNTVIPQLDSEYHAVINPDIFLHEDTLAIMADWMDQNPSAVIATPKLVFPDGKPQYTAKRRPAVLPLLARQIPLSFLKKYENHYLMLDMDLEQVQDVEFCSGCFFLVRTDAFKNFGGFDEGYFMYVEDADITQKARQLGRAVYLPQTSVAHAWHRDAHKKLRQFMWQLKSMLRYFQKWGWKLK